LLLKILDCFVSFVGHADLTLRYRLKCVVCKYGSETQKVPHIKHIDHSNSREHYLVITSRIE